MKNKKQLIYLIRVALFTALMCVSAFISIPITVPITLQTLVLFLSFFILGGKGSAVSVFLYVSIGALGLPVFSGFTGGISRLLDITGGYIFGMLAASLVYLALEGGGERIGKRQLAAAFLSQLTLYTVGTLWYTLVYADRASVGAVLLVCVVPFIIPDLIKLALAFSIAKRIPRQ